MSFQCTIIHKNPCLLAHSLDKIDFELGNEEAANGWPKYRSKEAGIATSVYASFDPDLSGKHVYYLIP